MADDPTLIDLLRVTAEQRRAAGDHAAEVNVLAAIETIEQLERDVERLEGSTVFDTTCPHCDGVGYFQDGANYDCQVCRGTGKGPVMILQPGPRPATNSSRRVEWVEWCLMNTAEGAYRMTIQRGDDNCWSIDEARKRMRPYHRDGDGFEVVEFRCSQRIGEMTCTRVTD